MDLWRSPNTMSSWPTCPSQLESSSGVTMSTNFAQTTLTCSSLDNTRYWLECGIKDNIAQGRLSAEPNLIMKKFSKWNRPQGISLTRMQRTSKSWKPGFCVFRAWSTAMLSENEVHVVQNEKYSYSSCHDVYWLMYPISIQDVGGVPRIKMNTKFEASYMYIFALMHSVHVCQHACALTESCRFTGYVQQGFPHTAKTVLIDGVNEKRTNYHQSRKHAKWINWTYNYACSLGCFSLASVTNM